MDFRIVDAETPEELGWRLPDLPAGLRPSTTGGGVVKGITQFGVGWVTGGRLLQAAKVPLSATAGGAIARGTVQGFIADGMAFDGEGPRLSDFVEREAPNPLTGYLATQPDDTIVEGRLKNALEGAMIGVPLELSLRSLRGLLAFDQLLINGRVLKHQVIDGYAPRYSPLVRARELEVTIIQIEVPPGALKAFVLERKPRQSALDGRSILSRGLAIRLIRLRCRTMSSPEISPLLLQMQMPIQGIQEQ